MNHADTQLTKFLRYAKSASPEGLREVLRPVARRVLPEDILAELRDKPVAVKPRLFFLRGHPRSGTNWVGNLLNLHPRVSCTGEYHFETIYHAMNRTLTLPWQLSSLEPVSAEIRAAFEELVRRGVAVGCDRFRPGAVWHGDRTPRDLQPLVADGRYIWIVRDGRDVAVSWTIHQIRRGRKVISTSIPAPANKHLLGLVEPFAANPTLFDEQPELLLSDEAWVRELARSWRDRLESDLVAAAEIENPKSDSRLLRMRYEELHTDPGTQQERLYRFLELDPAEAAQVSPETRTAPGFSQSDPMSFQRKGQIGDWRNYFTDQARAWFHDVAGDSLVRAGYAQDENW
jgi:hypothetical protein